MQKTFKVAQVRDLLNQVHNEKITFSRFVEVLNEKAEEHYSKVKKLNDPAVIKSAFKCDDIELQPIECENWIGCFDCPHYKAVL